MEVQRNGSTSRTSDSELATAAVELAGRGWAVTPVYGITEAGTCQCWKGLNCPPGDRAKHPRLENYLASASTDPSVVAEWWRVTPGSNIGIVTGRPSGLLVLDIDNRNGGSVGSDSLRALELDLGELPDTVTETTGGGGEHRFFALPTELAEFPSCLLAPGVEIKANGSQVVVTPSNHRSGGVYHWLATGHPDDGPPSELPERWVHAILRVTARRPKSSAPPPDQATLSPLDERERRARAYVAKMPEAIEGQRGSDALWAVAVVLAHGFVLPVNRALTVLTEDYNPRCRPAWKRSELLHKLEDARDKASVPWGYLLTGEKTMRKQASKVQPIDAARQRQKPTGDANQKATGDAADIDALVARLRGDRCTDAGNAERFAEQHKDRVIYLQTGAVLVWDGRRWTYDVDKQQVRELARQTAREIYREAADAPGEKERAELAKHAKNSENAKGINGMLSLTPSMPELRVHSSKLDVDPFLLNVANGTVDLRTGKRRLHASADFLTKLVPVEYDPEAGAPVFGEFLRAVFSENDALIDYVKRVFGYCLTGDVREHVLFFAHGNGRNGKSTLLNLLRAIGGDYATTVDTELILGIGRGADLTARDAKARLHGARIVVMQETSAGRKLAEGLVKNITGGDAIETARKYERSFEFDPTHKLLLAANHKPRIEGVDRAIWSRMRLIPFLRTFVDPNEEIPPASTFAPADPKLGDKLRGELPGILAWAVRGTREWLEHGLGTPQVVLDAVREYREEEDLLGGFVADCLLIDPTRKELFTTNAELKAAMKGWFDRNHETLPEKANTLLIDRLRAGGCERDEARNRTKDRGWRGVRIYSEGTDG